MLFPTEHQTMAQGPEASLESTQGVPFGFCIFSEGRCPSGMGLTISVNKETPQNLLHLSVHGSLLEVFPFYRQRA